MEHWRSDANIPSTGGGHYANVGIKGPPAK